MKGQNRLLLSVSSSPGTGEEKISGRKECYREVCYIRVVSAHGMHASVRVCARVRVFNPPPSKSDKAKE